MKDNSESSQHLDPTASPVTLHLPDDIVAAIAQLARQSGKSQTQLLIDALRQGLGLTPTLHSPALTLEQVIDRLTALEPLPQKVKELEARIDRLTTSRKPSQPQVPPPPAPLSESSPPNRLPDRQPSPLSPAVPSKEADASLPEYCPKCEHKLGALLKATGRQVCAKCGWTNKPRSSNSVKELPVDDLKQLLDQAAVDALTNMKPKGKQNPDKQNPGTGGLRFPTFGR